MEHIWVWVKPLQPERDMALKWDLESLVAWRSPKTHAKNTFKNPSFLQGPVILWVYGKGDDLK